MADTDPHDPTDPSESRGVTLAVTYGAAFGVILGTVVFAITQNPVWIGIGIPFGAAFGTVFGAVLQRPGQWLPSSVEYKGRSTTQGAHHHPAERMWCSFSTPGSPGKAAQNNAHEDGDGPTNVPQIRHSRKVECPQRVVCRWTCIFWTARTTTTKSAGS